MKRYIIFSEDYWEVRKESFMTRELAEKAIAESEWDSEEVVFEIEVSFE